MDCSVWGYSFTESKNKNQMLDNIDSANFSLEFEDMQLIDNRAVPGNRFRWKEDCLWLGFTDEVDLSYDGCWSNTVI